MALRNLIVRVGFNGTALNQGARQATQTITRFGQQTNRTMSGIGSAMKATLAVTAVAAIGAFTKSCVDMGSNLTEVQNVVDVTFGKLSAGIEQFAKASTEALGLSELSAKKYTSYMGAMLKSLGMTENASYDMSKSLTALSADMASFYNISNEEAFSKIRSGMTGSVIPLKELGINMSVASLEAYALSKGIKKSWLQMTIAERTILRYNYLLSVTKDSQGDFQRTSGTWANQTRILAENFNQIKATLGQGFINALLPVVKALNAIIGKLQVAATYFKAFSDKVFGTVEQGQKGVVLGADYAVNSMDEMGDSIEEAGKKATKATAGFDEVNTLAESLGDTSFADALPNDMLDIGTVPIGELDTTKLNKELEETAKKLRVIKTILASGFKAGLSTAPFKDINMEVTRLKKNIVDLFNDSKLKASTNAFVMYTTQALGKIAGSAISVGTSIATNLVGGINRYLESSKQYIQDRLVGIFDAGTVISRVAGDFSTLISSIFALTFTSEKGMELTGNIIGMFSSAGLGFMQVGLQLAGDIFKGIYTVFANNKQGIVDAINGSLGVMATVTGTIKDSVEDSFKSIFATYEQYVRPAFDKLTEAFSKATESSLRFYNEIIVPVLNGMAKDFDETFKKHIQPAINSGMEVFGAFASLVGTIFNQVLLPFDNWLKSTLGPTFGKVLYSAIQWATTILGGFADGIANTNKAMVDLLNFMTNVFENGWKSAWDSIWNNGDNAIENIYKGALKLKDVLNPIQAIADAIAKSVAELASTEFKWGKDKPSVGVPDTTTGYRPASLPKMATGGIVTRSTIANIGEAGAEAVLPLENNTGWMDTLAIKLANSMGAMQGNSGGGGRQSATLEIDGRTLAEMIIPYIPEASRRMGVSLNGC